MKDRTTSVGLCDKPTIPGIVWQSPVGRVSDSVTCVLVCPANGGNDPRNGWSSAVSYTHLDVYKRQVYRHSVKL